MNLHDDHWQKLARAIAECNLPGTKSRNNRLFIEAVFWVVLNHRGWSKLPTRFGKWRTNYMRFRRWNESGLWHAMTRVETEDPELTSMLEIIANWGDTYLDHVAERKKRAYERHGIREAGRETRLNSSFSAFYDLNAPADVEIEKQWSPYPWPIQEFPIASHDDENNMPEINFLLSSEENTSHVSQLRVIATCDPISRVFVTFKIRE